MPGIPENDIVQVRIDYFHFDQTLMNVLNYRCVASATTGTIADETQALADLCAGNGTGSLADKLVAVLPSTCDITQIRVQDIVPTRWAYRFAIVGRAGARSAAPSANVDAVVTKRTDLSGDGMQGNFFLPGIGAEDMAEGLLTAGFVTLLETNLAILKSALITPNDGVYEPVIFNRLTTARERVTSVFVHNTVRVLVRRTVGRGI